MSDEFIFLEKRSLINAKNFVSSRIPIYIAFSKSSEWHEAPSTLSPEIVEGIARKSIIGMKRIFGDSMHQVSKRINWDNLVFSRFGERPYAINSNSEVYKCIKTGVGKSTVEPSGDSPYRFTTTDGYIWKFIMKIDETSKFSSSDYFPVSRIITDDGSPQWKTQNLSIPGTLDYIDVTSRGSGFIDYKNVKFKLDGDGMGASVFIKPEDIVNGEIIRVRVDKSGSMYSYMNISLEEDSEGSSFLGVGVVSNPEGHGNNPEIDLSSKYVNIISRISGSENGSIMIGGSYFMSLIISSQLDRSGSQLNKETYDNRIKIKVSGSNGNFVKNTKIENNTGDSEGYITNIGPDLLYIVELKGNLNVGEIIKSGPTFAKIEEIIYPNIDEYSGIMKMIKHHQKREYRLENNTNELSYIMEF